MAPALLLVCASAYGGYTHYFTWAQTPDEAKLKACIQEMMKLIEARKSMLAGPDGTGTVKVDSSHIEFNGKGEDAHEPFIFPGPIGENFCKTQWKPYDAVVTACLLVARDHFPDSILKIGSDGDWDAWTEGILLYSSVLGRTPQNPLPPRSEDSEGDSPYADESDYPAHRPMSRGWLIAIALVVAIVTYFVWVKGKR
jgi:hypothetical protein